MTERLLRVLRDAISCMNLTKPPLYYYHPEAERVAHFQNLSTLINSHVDLFRNFTVGFAPWCWAGVCTETLEDAWIHHTNASMVLFGPFVPLFVPWLRLWGMPEMQSSRYWSVRKQILTLLRPDYLYVTVSQNSQGIEGTDDPTYIPKNVLVLSSGGKGHIPILLWLKEFTPAMFPIPRSYKYDVVFLGNLKTHWIRQLLCNAMVSRMNVRSYVSGQWDWETIYSQSKFILCPRGFGRNSYRLGEVLQMGMVPVYVYTDIIWLPYYDSVNWSEFAVVVRWNEFNGTLSRYAKTKARDIRRMRLRIRELYPTHFSPEGVWRQIFAFLQDGFSGSDLRCSRFSHDRDTVPRPT
jgi:hypothetical protein